MKAPFNQNIASFIPHCSSSQILIIPPMVIHHFTYLKFFYGIKGKEMLFCLILSSREIICFGKDIYIMMTATWKWTHSFSFLESCLSLRTPFFTIQYCLRADFWIFSLIKLNTLSTNYFDIPNRDLHPFHQLFSHIILNTFQSCENTRRYLEYLEISMENLVEKFEQLWKYFFKVFR